MAGGLLDILLGRIALGGPLTVADYMAEALGHPRFGYYATRDPFGAAGDFVTAPEISQMFGELIGLWCAVVWQAMGEPDPVRWVELGPGRGTLMADAIRAGRTVQGFLQAAHLHLVETSPTLRSIQADTLAKGSPPRPPLWHADLSDIPDGPVILIANEFLDALPIRQFERTAAGWCERLVAAGPGGDGLIFALSPPSCRPPMLLSPAVFDAPLGAICDQSATDRDLDLTTRLAVPGLPLLGATDGGWNLELMVPWAALGDLDAASFGLACETIRPGCEPATLRWPGDGLAARLTGLPDLSPFRLTTGPVEVSVEGVGAAAVLVVELPITNRTGRDFEGFAKAALERADGLSLAEAEVRVSNGGSGTVRWDFKPGQGAATLLWRIECAAAPTLRRTGRARL